VLLLPNWSPFKDWKDKPKTKRKSHFATTRMLLILSILAISG